MPPEVFEDTTKEALGGAIVKTLGFIAKPVMKLLGKKGLRSVGSKFLGRGASKGLGLGSKFLGRGAKPGMFKTIGAQSRGLKSVAKSKQLFNQAARLGKGHADYGKVMSQATRMAERGRRYGALAKRGPLFGRAVAGAANPRKLVTRGLSGLGFYGMSKGFSSESNLRKYQAAMSKLPPTPHY